MHTPHTEDIACLRKKGRKKERKRERERERENISLGPPHIPFSPQTFTEPKIPLAAAYPPAVTCNRFSRCQLVLTSQQTQRVPRVPCASSPKTGDSPLCDRQSSPPRGLGNSSEMHCGTRGTQHPRCGCCGRTLAMWAGRIRHPTAGSCSTGLKLATSGGDCPAVGELHWRCPALQWF